jgi:hypothetical protein
MEDPIEEPQKDPHPFIDVAVAILCLALAAMAVYICHYC